MHASRIETCLDKLTPEQIWYRGSDNSNAIGNLVYPFYIREGR